MRSAGPDSWRRWMSTRPGWPPASLVERFVSSSFQGGASGLIKSQSISIDTSGRAPGTYHSDAIFLRSPLTPTQVMKMVKLRDGVDRAWPGQGVIYFQRLSAERTKSRLSKIVATPAYKSMTIRSWTTTTKLLKLLDDRKPSS